MDDIAGRKKLLEISGLKQGRVLDVGMGDCACMSFYLARRGFHVVGIDRSPKAVHDSRTSAVKKRFKGTFTARKANAERFPFHHDEFDAVIAFNSFHHMDSIRKVINEMFRVCNKGGLILISDLHEEPQKASDCESDNGSLLKRIEVQLTKKTTSIRKVGTKHNMMFICKKPTALKVWSMSL